MRSVTDDSARSASAITPSDANNLTRITKAFTISVAGDVKVDFADSGTVTMTGLVVGTVYYMAVRKVYATGTTATGIIGYYS